MSTAIYNRISQDNKRDTDEEGAGVARQERECRAKAKQLGWNDITVFQDNDISASKGKHRPGYEALVEGIKDGSITRLIVWHPDRLHRRLAELVPFVELANTAKLEVATVQSGNLDLASVGGRLVAKIVGSVAEAEMELKSERQIAKAAEHAKAGKPAGGNRTFGWTDGMKSIIASEAAVIREAAERVIGGEGPRAIAADFNRREIPTANGGQWWGQVIRKLLVHPRLIAKRVYRGEVVADAEWSPILDIETFAQVEAVLTDPRRAKIRRGTVYPLSGLMVDHRGIQMSGAPGGKAGFRRYRTNVPSGVKNTQIGATSVEKEVFDTILTFSDTESFPLVEGSKLDVEMVQNLEAEVEELLALKNAGRLSLAEYLTLRDPVVEKLTVAKQSVTAVRAVPKWLHDLNKPGALRENWHKLDDAQKRRVCELFIDKIVVSAAKDGVAPKDRFEVTWKG